MIDINTKTAKYISVVFDDDSSLEFSGGDAALLYQTIKWSADRDIMAHILESKGTYRNVNMRVPIRLLDIITEKDAQ